MQGVHFYLLLWFTFIYQITTTNGFTLPFSSFSSMVLPRKPSNSSIAPVSRLPKVDPCGSLKELTKSGPEVNSCVIDNVSKASTDFLSVLPFSSNSETILLQEVTSSNGIPLPSADASASNRFDRSVMSSDISSILLNSPYGYLPNDPNMLLPMIPDLSALKSIPSSPVETSCRSPISTRNELLVNGLSSDVNSKLVNTALPQRDLSPTILGNVGDLNLLNSVPIDAFPRCVIPEDVGAVSNLCSMPIATPSYSSMPNYESFIPIATKDAILSSAATNTAKRILFSNAPNASSFFSALNPSLSQASLIPSSPSLSLIPNVNLPTDTCANLPKFKVNPKSLDLKIMPLSSSCDITPIQGLVRPLIRNKTSSSCPSSLLKSLSPQSSTLFTSPVNDKLSFLNQFSPVGISSSTLLPTLPLSSKSDAYQECLDESIPVASKIIPPPKDYRPYSYVNQNLLSVPSQPNSEIRTPQIKTLSSASNSILSLGCPIIQDIGMAGNVQSTLSSPSPAFNPSLESTFTPEQSLTARTAASLPKNPTIIPSISFCETSANKISPTRYSVSPVSLSPEANLLQYLSPKGNPSQLPTEVCGLQNSPLNYLPQVALNPSQPFDYSVLLPVTTSPSPNLFVLSSNPSIIETVNSEKPIIASDISTGIKSLPFSATSPNALPLLSSEPNVSPILSPSLPNINMPSTDFLASLLQNPFKKLTPVLNTPELISLQTVNPTSTVSSSPSLINSYSSSYFNPDSLNTALYNQPSSFYNNAQNSQISSLDPNIISQIPINVYNYNAFNSIPTINQLPQVISSPQTYESSIPIFASPVSINSPLVEINSLPYFASSPTNYVSLLEVPISSTTPLSSICTNVDTTFSSIGIPVASNGFRTINSDYSTNPLSELSSSIDNVVDLLVPSLLSIKIPSVSDCEDMSSLPVVFPGSYLNSNYNPNSPPHTSDLVSKLTNTMLISALSNLTSTKTVPPVQSIPVVSLPKAKRKSKSRRRYSPKSKTKSSIFSNMMVASPSESNPTFAEPLNKTKAKSSSDKLSSRLSSSLPSSSDSPSIASQNSSSFPDLTTSNSKDLEPAHDESSVTQSSTLLEPNIKKRSSSKEKAPTPSSNSSSVENPSLSNTSSNHSSPTLKSSKDTLSSSSSSSITSATLKSSKDTSSSITSVKESLDDAPAQFRSPEEIVEFIVLKQLLNSDPTCNWDLLEKIIDILCSE